MTKKFLDGAYDLDGPDETRALYADWAASYDAEIAANGYATPRRCAEALAAIAEDRSAPVLDIGCGTGLSGLALRAAGFATIDGSDVSAEMLEGARARTDIYRSLRQVTLEDPFPFAPGTYQHITAVGVFSPGHAPPETLDAVLDLLPAGGCFCFSLNDHALADPAYPKKIDAVTEAGTADLVFREHGPHLPGRGLEADVCVLKKR